MSKQNLQISCDSFVSAASAAEPKVKIVAIDFDGTLSWAFITKDFVNYLKTNEGQKLRGIIDREYVNNLGYIKTNIAGYETTTSNYILSKIGDINTLGYLYRVPENKEANQTVIYKIIQSWAEEFYLGQNIFRDQEDLEESITSLIESGKKVAIATYCMFPPLVHWALDKLNIDDDIKGQIEIICGIPEDPQKYGKNLHLQTLQNYYYHQSLDNEIFSNESVALFDDSRINIDCANRAGYKPFFTAIHQKKLFLDGVKEYLLGEEYISENQSWSEDGSYEEPDFCRAVSSPDEQENNLDLDEAERQELSDDNSENHESEAVFCMGVMNLFDSF